RSRSAPPAGASTAGSASFHVRPATSRGSAGLCRWSDTWTATSRSYEAPCGVNQVNHFRRVVLIWLLCSVILTPIVIFVFAPTVPPGQGSVQASGQVLDNTVLFGLSTPITLAVLVYFAYAFIAFRERDPAAALEGPAIRGHAGVQIWRLVVT